MTRSVIPLAIGGVVLLVGGLALASGDAQGEGSVSAGPVWRDPDAPRRIRAYAKAIEAHTGWAGLGDYLAATAYTESRGDSEAVGDSGRSWGWFQLRPAAKCMQWLGLSGADLIHDEALQVAVAACHAYRLGTIYDSPGQLVQWRDIRRGWKFPKWVASQYRDVPETETNEKRFRQGLYRVGVSGGFRFRRAFPAGMEMLPIDYLVQIVRGANVA